MDRNLETGSVADHTEPEVKTTVKPGGKTRQLTGRAVTVVKIIAIAMSLFVIYSNYLSDRLPFGTVLQMQKNNLFIMFTLLLTYILYPARKKDREKALNIFDIMLCILAAAGPIYIAFRYTPEFATNSTTVTMDYIMAGITAVIVLEACRRIHGPIIPCIVMVFVVYALFASHAPGFLRFRNVPIKRLLFRLYLTGEGMWGSMVSTASSYLFIFILFGAVLEISGGAKAFNDIGFAIGGRMRGGPAQVAVFSSALMGSISGSAVANVMTTGAFTIPLMRKMGYDKDFAGSVEAAASTGGVITPPVMGSVAFIMAGNTGIPYSRIIIAAMMPAVLYYAGIVTTVALEARKKNLPSLPKNEIPKLSDVLKKEGIYLLPVVVIIVTLLSGMTALYAGLCGILASLLVSQLHKETRMGWKQILLALEKGAKGAISIAVACITCTFIVTVVTMTGLGTNLAVNIVRISGGKPFVALLLIAVVILFMSMGMPGPACYIIVTTVAAQSLISMGFKELATHLFCMWIGTMSNLTPPVCMASFAASSLSGGSLSRTAWNGLRLAAAGLIVPFIFVFNPVMIYQDATVIGYFWSFLTGLVGVIALAVSLQGYVFCKLPVLLRLTSFIAAMTLIHPSPGTDFIGIALLAVTLAGALAVNRNNTAKPVSDC
ncbi:MAG: TRAP transporter permease [Firmicutes bacterium]|nr:TRAP transporter permease [Bacillota bacterium]